MSPARRPARRAGSRRRHRWSRFRVGLVALIVLTIPVYLAFAKDIPFTKGYRVTAVFESANNLRPGSPVRIAGVNVGRVKTVERYKDTDLSAVEMEISDEGLPLHRDATLKIRSRIFLEGNFFVDVSPGTPGAPEIENGGTIAVTQTSTPVQLDQVLSALQSDSREDLQIVLKEYGAALTSRPTPEQDAQLQESVRGKTAAEAINQSYDTAGDALRGTAIVTDALTGQRTGDLSRTISAIARLSTSLSQRERALQDLIVDFNLTTSAFANQSGALSETIRELGPTLQTARTSLRTVDRALPSTRAFAREILPGVRETAATVDASFPWIEQARALMGPDELQGLMTELTPATRDLGRLTDQSIELLPELDDFAQCFARVILPAGNVGLQDGDLTNRRPDGSVVEAYKEFWYGLVGIAGTGQNFDANGTYLRAAASGGEWQVRGGQASVEGGTLADRTLVATAPERPLGSRPLFPAREPAIQTSVPCRSNALPDLNGSQAGPGPAPDSVAVPTPPPYDRARAEAETPGTQTPNTAAASLGTTANTDASLGAKLLSRLNPFAGVTTR